MDEPLRASSSQASLHSTTAAVPAACSNGKGKGGHISALRSLGLLHELQEYVAACVETQQQQEKELGKLKAEKKEVERALKHRALRTTEKQPCVQQFQASEICDLPPRLRALFEDNKVLKEQARRYKQRCQESERHAASLEQQLLAVQSANSKLKVQLLEGHAGQDSDAAQARQQADALAKAREKLQHAHHVLQQKLETDARLHKQALAAAAKERQQVEAQVQELQAQLDCKDKEARTHALAAKQAQRKMEETKAAAAKAVASVNARVAEAVAAAEAHCKQVEDARVHLMLCVIRESSSGQQQQGRQQLQPVRQQEGPADSLGGVWADDSSSLVSRQTGVSSCYTGSLSREQAVLTLQAGARGYLARKQLKRQLQQQHEVLVVMQHQSSTCWELEAAGSCDGNGANTGCSDGTGGIDMDAQQSAPGCRTAPEAGLNLPLELPELPAPGGSESQAGASADPVATLFPPAPAPAAAVAVAGVSARPAAAAGGVTSLSHSAAAGGSSVTRAGRHRVSTAAAASAGFNSNSRKPPVPAAAAKAPPASAPHRARPVRQESRPRHSSTNGWAGGGVAEHTLPVQAVMTQEKDGAAAGSCNRAAAAAGMVDRSVAGVHNGGSRKQQQQQADRQRRLSLQPRPPAGATSQSDAGSSSRAARRLSSVRQAVVTNS